ncbi:hypothetical protein TrCOL_g10042 [Triparma columacea]|uniref:tRNA-5-taurinomethyluridine 2-sulfurtransferase n=1 Tax=Triparma columacea TaxID=722753 RepID=A0A9W7G8S3_9STRA|nr:hypothetical protein TrCOL_g10042 [Triparma columacea]
MKEKGYKVTAFYLKIWLQDELAHLSECPWEDDLKICRDVCDRAGVELEVISLMEEYHERVVGYTVEEARKGRTPNPDIMCNSRVKFGVFLDEISKRGFDVVASGHYAQVGGGGRLIRGVDEVKDQSYFLCGLSKDVLEGVQFPVGGLEKSQVRELAKKFDLPNRDRPDSQGLCFLGKVKFDAFIGAYLGENPGEVLNAASGEVVGRHNGLWFHTVGQRKGLGSVLDVKVNSKGPWYVVKKNVKDNRLFVSNEYEKFEEVRKVVVVEELKWREDVGGKEGKWDMKIRHGPKLAKGRVEEVGGGRGKVFLNEKDGGLAPGQYIAFYDDEGGCVGSCVIGE